MNLVKDILTSEELMQIEFIKHSIRNARTIKDIKKLQKKANEIIARAETRYVNSKDTRTFAIRERNRDKILNISLFKRNRSCV